ncbi:MAG: hypothetical protein GTN64_07460 [Candidatus Latescibacteria bacterium]|nr:hypothetical protein [Candidatus Latescibacterota bacterium]NIO78440.1 hypothetical protein [Candidatus Latescibacterota bacterium]
MMIFKPKKCPACALPPSATTESIEGYAILEEKDGAFEYTGETEIDNNNQETVTDGLGRVTLWCENDHNWKAEMEEKA